MKYGIVLSLVAAFAASVAMAEGIPSQSKLNSLGLSSMNVVSDQAGEEVRGKAFFKIIAGWQAQAGEKTLVNVPAQNGNSVTIDPATFVAHDQNSGSLIVTDGLPLGNAGLAFTSPIAVQNSADAFHQQDVLINDPTLPGPFNFSEISASINTFTAVIQWGP